jgi:hypothetical protein
MLTQNIMRQSVSNKQQQAAIQFMRNTSDLTRNLHRQAAHGTSGRKVAMQPGKSLDLGLFTRYHHLIGYG